LRYFLRLISAFVTRRLLGPLPPPSLLSIFSVCSHKERALSRKFSQGVSHLWESGPYRLY
jgi:hypothetical protein